MSASRTLNDDLRMEQATISSSSSSPLQASAIATATRPHHHPPDGDRARSTPTHALRRCGAVPPTALLTFWLRSAPPPGGGAWRRFVALCFCIRCVGGGRARRPSPNPSTKQPKRESRDGALDGDSVAAGSVRQELTSGTACQRGRSRSRGDLQCGPRGWSWRRPGLCAVVEAGETACTVATVEHGFPSFRQGNRETEMSVRSTERNGASRR